MIIANTCSKGAFTNYVDKILALLTTYLLVYDQNHYFGLGPIQKQKQLSAVTVRDTKTTFQRENLVTDSVGYFFLYKRALKTKFAAKS